MPPFLTFSVVGSLVLSTTAARIPLPQLFPFICWPISFNSPNFPPLGNFHILCLESLDLSISFVLVLFLSSFAFSLSRTLIVSEVLLPFVSVCFQADVYIPPCFVMGSAAICSFFCWTLRTGMSPTSEWRTGFFFRTSSLLSFFRAIGVISLEKVRGSEKRRVGEEGRYRGEAQY
eukprot:RCo029592